VLVEFRDRAIKALDEWTILTMPTRQGFDGLAGRVPLVDVHLTRPSVYNLLAQCGKILAGVRDRPPAVGVANEDQLEGDFLNLGEIHQDHETVEFALEGVGVERPRVAFGVLYLRLGWREE
jgi:hypothetical protein